MIHLGLWGYPDLSGSTTKKTLILFVCLPLTSLEKKIQSYVSHEGI